MFKSRRLRRLNGSVRKKDRLDKKIERNKKKVIKKHMSNSLKLNIVICLWILDKLAMIILFMFRDELKALRDLIRDLIYSLF